MPWPRLNTWPGTCAGFIEHRIDVAAQLRRRSKECGRIEVALDGFVRAQRAANHAERRTPIHADDVDIEPGDRIDQGGALVRRSR